MYLYQYLLLWDTSYIVGNKSMSTSQSKFNRANPFSCSWDISRWMLWQPLITKTNDHTSGKFLKLDIKWEVHKRIQQGVSAKLETYIYKVHMVCTTTSYLPHSLLKATMLYTYSLTSSSRFFYHVLGLWHHIMWHVMWLWHHVPLHHLKEKQNQYKIRKIK